MAGLEDIRPQTPISPQSRLLIPRNLSVKQAVRGNVKLRSLKETEEIRRRTTEANLLAKKKVEQELNTKLNRAQDLREGRLEEWIQKTSNSPYRLDQNEVDLVAMERCRERNKRQRFFKDRKKLIKSMDGKPNMEFLTDNVKASMTVEETLAVEHLTLLKTINKLKYEQNKLTELVHSDCDETERKFARIAVARAQKRALERSGTSMASVSRGSSLLSTVGPITPSTRARTYKKIDNTVYSADGRWNESGQFVVAKSEKDKVGLISAKYAKATGDTAPVLAVRRKTEIFKMEMGIDS